MKWKKDQALSGKTSTFSAACVKVSSTAIDVGCGSTAPPPETLQLVVRTTEDATGPMDSGGVIQRDASHAHWIETMENEHAHLWAKTLRSYEARRVTIIELLHWRTQCVQVCFLSYWHLLVFTFLLIWESCKKQKSVVTGSLHPLRKVLLYLDHSRLAE